GIVLAANPWHMLRAADFLLPYPAAPPEPPTSVPSLVGGSLALRQRRAARGKAPAASTTRVGCRCHESPLSRVQPGEILTRLGARARHRIIGHHADRSGILADHCWTLGARGCAIDSMPLYARAAANHYPDRARSGLADHYVVLTGSYEAGSFHRIAVG